MADDPGAPQHILKVETIIANQLALRSLVATMLRELSNLHTAATGSPREFLSRTHADVISRIEGAEFFNIEPSVAERITAEAAHIASRMFAGVAPPATDAAQDKG